MITLLLAFMSQGPEDATWPLEPRPAVERLFDPPPLPWAAGHRGVDLAAAHRAPVRAAAAGRVTFAGRIAGRGVLTIGLADGLRLTYEPVTATVAVGDLVGAGDPVGVLEDGPYHCATPCLHWGLLRGDTYLDPLALLSRGPSRLLPSTGVPLPAGSVPAGAGSEADPAGPGDPALAAPAAGASGNPPRSGRRTCGRPWTRPRGRATGPPRAAPAARPSR
ncbi:M23 family metallopeptidase [Streptomyces sp. ACA25]|uniref:M23 family metallopeptidase n=1 Tax=Streptomyces sp. ACA25 TaxID=3022596 RepID=UPI002306FE36|nr:M23 family metallopeptidase [Streptomyces sp. ACA25]MDB1089651.1 M23 family metallopeptidase [Streptomyces sp. ACA25]